MFLRSIICFDNFKMRAFFVLFLLISPFNAYKRQPSFLRQDEIDHVRPARDEASVCNEDNLMNFLAEIQVVNPESILKLATLKELEPSCRRVSENLEKIQDYLKTCTPTNEPDLYLQLIKGVQALHGKICTDSPFKKRFANVHSCLHELKSDLEDCEGPADWNENSDNNAVCKAYKNIADCYFIKTAEVCGKNAAVVTKELLQAIIDSILTINCDNVRATPQVTNAMPDTYIKKGNTKAGAFKTPVPGLIATTTALYLLRTIY